MNKTFLKFFYPIFMGLFSYSLWNIRTPVSTNSGLNWDEFVSLRYICLIGSVAFWVLALISLVKRHRSFPLLWGGAVIVASMLLILPTEPGPPPWPYLPIFLAGGLLAHLLLLVANERRIPR